MQVKKIYNIFSKKTEKIEKDNSKKHVVIDVDYREKNSLVYSHLVKLGIGVKFKELKVADYIVKGVAVERKTVQDFVSSMINKRLFRQLEEMQQYNSNLLIIEGIDEQELYSDQEIIEGEKIGLHPNAIRGFLLSILLKYKVPIIFTKNQEDTAKFISLIAKKQKRDTSLRPTKRTHSKKEQIQFILEGFPGVGPKTSKKLIKKFKNLEGIFNASLEELQEILGKKAESFKELLEHKETK